MKNFFAKSIIALACLALVALPLTVTAQSSDVGLSIKTGSSTVNRGSGVAIFALVTNNSTTRTRTTVSMSAFSPCGTETSLGEQRISLEPGKSVSLSVYYPIPADACTGMYAVTISADSGKGSGKGSNASTSTASATAYVEVQ